jgi:epoxyqueuosine reductase
LEKESHIQKLTDLIRVEALKLGFLDCGFSQVRTLCEVEEHYRQWLRNNYHASMSYLERNLEKRLNPGLLVENSKSVISLLYNYYTPDAFSDQEYKISKYAYGDDYHDVIRERLNSLDKYIRQIAENVEQRCFVDSAPVFERQWAMNSGLGWIGKNTCLITKKQGSFVFIAEIITNLELKYNAPVKDYCGSCSKCIEACPTGAILPDRTINSHKCISYITIENKEAIPNYFKNRIKNFIFGCDICQDVCPWNKKSVQHNEPLFILNKRLSDFKKVDWKVLNEGEFKELFRKSAVKRTKYSGLVRNINFIDDINQY